MMTKSSKKISNKNNWTTYWI